MHISDNKVLKNVELYFNRNVQRFGMTSLDAEDRDHLIRCGAAVVETYLGMNKYEHGSFVKAVANNDLKAAFNCADSINSKHMQFHAGLLYSAWEIAHGPD